MAGGAAALNQVWERETDRLDAPDAALRPIPGGRLRIVRRDVVRDPCSRPPG